MEVQNFFITASELLDPKPANEDVIGEHSFENFLTTSAALVSGNPEDEKMADPEMEEPGDVIHTVGEIEDADTAQVLYEDKMAANVGGDESGFRNSAERLANRDVASEHPPLKDALDAGGDALIPDGDAPEEVNPAMSVGNTEKQSVNLSPDGRHEVSGGEKGMPECPRGEDVKGADEGFKGHLKDVPAEGIAGNGGRSGTEGLKGEVPEKRFDNVVVARVDGNANKEAVPAYEGDVATAEGNGAGREQRGRNNSVSGDGGGVKSSGQDISLEGFDDVGDDGNGSRDTLSPDNGRTGSHGDKKSDDFSQSGTHQKSSPQVGEQGGRKEHAGFRIVNESSSVAQEETERIELSRFVMKGGKGKVKMELSPPSLGRLKVELSLNDNQLRAVFHSDSNLARAALECNMHSLRDSLAVHDMNLESFDVLTGGSGRENGGDKSFGPSEWVEKVVEAVPVRDGDAPEEGDRPCIGSDNLDIFV